MSLLLASSSQIRAQLLDSAGVSFSVEKPSFDEASVKQDPHFQKKTPLELAHYLASQKALSIKASSSHFVLGADQILSFEGEVFNKPKDMEEARAHLKTLRGKSHHLETAIAIAQRGEIIFQAYERPRLVMRNFSDAFLENYLEANKTSIMESVGAYKLEAEGVQLFSEIEGDYFSILGLPMLKLLEFLRDQGILEK